MPALPGIERAAAQLFPPGVLPLHLREQVIPTELLTQAQTEGRLWVALAPDERPVRFAIAQIAGEAAFLTEVDVHPNHGRKGLGRALIGAVIAWARAQGFTAVTLTTFAHLLWNAPFYEQLGFRRLSGPEFTPHLARVLHDEAQEGLRDRVAMRLQL